MDKLHKALDKVDKQVAEMRERWETLKYTPLWINILTFVVF